MAFSQATISEVTTARSFGDLVVSWASSAAAGTVFQVYVGRRLAWWGTARSVRIPYPQTLAPVEVGAVAATEGPADLSGSLPSAPDDRVSLTWTGGTFLGDVAGYRVYAGTGPGVGTATVLVATVPAYHGAVTDGYGLGGFNRGGYGQSATSHSWTSGPLPSGAWAFAVAPVDAAGNALAAPTPVTATVASPPRAPAPGASGDRLTYAYNATTHVATLSWLASSTAYTPQDPTTP